MPVISAMSSFSGENAEGNTNYIDLNTKLCSTEAEAAVDEVAFGVKDIRLASKSLPFSDSVAYLNLTTLEGDQMCIEVTSKGFASVGNCYDAEILQQDPTYYETIYSLLSNLSKGFRDNFSARLSDKLKEITEPPSSS